MLCTKANANAKQGKTAQHKTRLTENRINQLHLKPTKTEPLPPSTLSDVFPVHAQECGSCSMYAKPNKGYIIPYHLNALT